MRKLALVAAAASLVPLRAAHAGMPSFDLTDVASLRLHSLSFFAVAFLACAAGIRWLWNGLRKDFPKLPELSYRRALALLALWGFVFLFVLTMISGARELLTPGAWKKDGATYKLADPPALTPESRTPEQLEPERHARLLALKEHLWKWSSSHEGALPPDPAGAPEIPAAAWRVVDHPDAVRYVYVPGQRASEGAGIVAYEPAAYGAWRFALLASGKVELLAAATIEPKAAARR